MYQRYYKKVLKIDIIKEFDGSSYQGITIHYTPKISFDQISSVFLGDINVIQSNALMISISYSLGCRMIGRHVNRKLKKTHLYSSDLMNWPLNPKFTDILAILDLPGRGRFNPACAIEQGVLNQH